MEKKIIFWVISLSLVAVALAILLPGGRKVDTHPRLPWDISVNAYREIEVFDLTLNKSLLADARQVFQQQGKLNMFTTSSGHPALEVYFERVFLSGLRADIILVLNAEDDLLSALYDRGSRISRSTDTTRKVELNSEDQLLAANLPIESINYIPAANLDESLIISRFGEAPEKITETETSMTHWIYPEKGLSIGISPEGRELLQYMPLEKIEPFIDRIRENNRLHESNQG
ncbi:MAG: hypothetical protein KZQ88_18975 [Candidatus Thiodiazotropha sp. (ex Dulcina madagascariensis)]|nr:hypothetical protein [Candidatus Thiodiazotropha sp. (ex Dulcina madagascariensis)]MCU7926446.1 hypothetical protein [Candidatus Thiodiazotropha sp. (ex Dulcina madagascariensis)]